MHPENVRPGALRVLRIHGLINVNGKGIQRIRIRKNQLEIISSTVSRIKLGHRFYPYTTIKGDTFQ
jgi:hypothetical protein